VILINLSDQDFTVHNGDRICQMVIAKYEQAELQQVEVLSDSVRADGGFGHTGV
jgi:dUTP pyrophosphatase